MWIRDGQPTRADADVCACLLVHGGRGYFRAGREAALALLDRSDFDVFVALGAGRGPRPPRSPRLRAQRLRLREHGDERARGFLLKFEALEACLQQSRSAYIALLDADAVLVAPTRARDVRSALGNSPLGMVEQTGIRGSDMDRAGFLEHYREHSLAFLAPDRSAPAWEDFRFFNSGVVLLTRDEAGAIVRWARAGIAAATGPHALGEHMIADQDYFQVWANTLHPGRCKTLDWHWNHCEHWDDDFPRAGARFLHFSNFCNGPNRESLARIRRARRGAAATGFAAGLGDALRLRLGRGILS